VSERIRRVDHLLQEEISAIIRREVHDPRVGFVTITGVDVTPDLRHATVWASIIGSPAERRATLQVLGRAMPYVRHHLGVLRLKRIPELHLREDDSAERGTRVMQLIEQVSGGSAEESTLPIDAGVTPPVSPPSPPLPSPHALNEAGPGLDGVEPLPAGYRRHVDRDALRRARRRRGR
jgi:ribosome-binding factor A